MGSPRQQQLVEFGRLGVKFLLPYRVPMLNRPFSDETGA